MEAQNLISCMALCERWGVTLIKLRALIHELKLDVYYIVDGIEPAESVLLEPGTFDYWAEGGALEVSLADVARAESDNPGLVLDLGAKARRDYGRLQRQALAADDAIRATAVAIEFALKSNLRIKKADLWKHLESCGVNIPETVFRKIWKAIPDKYRKGAGRPKNMIG